MLLDREYVRFLILKGLFKKSFRLANEIHKAGGTALEFGVFRGSSFIFQAHQIKNRYVTTKLVGFDSWSGLPEETSGIWFPGVHEKGQYRSTKDVVISRMKKAGLDPSDTSKYRFVDGFYQDSLTPEVQNQISNVIFVNIDVDIHKSTIELLNFVKPLLRPGAIIYWDDWKSPLEKHEGEWGEHLAWKEWCQENTHIKAETLDVNWLNQRTMVVTAVGNDSLSPEQLKAVYAKCNELDSVFARLEKFVLKSKLARSLLQVVFRIAGTLQTSHGDLASEKKS